MSSMKDDLARGVVKLGRRKRRVTAVQCAAEMGISVSTYYRWLRTMKADEHELRAIFMGASAQAAQRQAPPLTPLEQFINTGSAF